MRLFRKRLPQGDSVLRRGRPSLEDLERTENLPGYGAVAEKLALARALVSYSAECLSDSVVGHLADGAPASPAQLSHLATCEHCSAMLDVTRAHSPDPLLANALAAVARDESRDTSVITTPPIVEEELADMGSTSEMVAWVSSTVMPLGGGEIAPTDLARLLPALAR